MRAGPGYVAVVESAYSFDGDERRWLEGLAKASSPLLDRGQGVALQLFHPSSVVPIDSMILGASPTLPALIEHLRANPSDDLDRMFSIMESGVVTVRSLLAKRADLFEAWLEAERHTGFADILGICCRAGDRTIILFTPSPSPLPPPHHKVATAWRRVAHHIGAARRLRVALGSDDPTTRGEAILDSRGAIQHVTGGARPRESRQLLRRAVLAMERARGPLRREDPDAALGLWRSLVDGRWSLLDHFDRDGKRFLVAVENAPTHRARALRPRESAAIKLAIEGNGPKDIAYALGISASNARALLAVGLAKLGFRRRAELYQLDLGAAAIHSLAEGQSPIHAAAVPVRGADAVRAPLIEPLTPAEDEVRKLAEGGATNSQIARARRTSVRTVANQMASILRKLGARSRAELTLKSG